MQKTLLVLFIAYVVIFVAAMVFQRSLMYFPFDNTRAVPEKDSGVQIVDVTTQDSLTLQSWYVPAKQDVKNTVVLFHGNAGNFRQRIPKAMPFIQNGYGVLFVEYRGYGGNPGRPSEQGLYQDARAYVEWLLKDHNLAQDELIFYGESLGTGVAVQMATEYDIKALILDVPFNTAVDVAKSKFPIFPFLDALMKDQYRSVDKIDRINAPVLIGLAGKDRIVPARFGRKLFEAAVEPKQLKEYPPSGHMDIHIYGFDKDMLAFLEAL